MKNILSATPNQVAQAALKYSADMLLEAAETAGAATSDELHTYLDESEKRTIKLTRELREQIVRKINAVQGGLKGPSQNAREELDTWAAYAIELHYRLGDADVQAAFADFLLALVTEGFVNVNTTSTQMGNFTHGVWRGGGFGT